MGHNHMAGRGIMAIMPARERLLLPEGCRRPKVEAAEMMTFSCLDSIRLRMSSYLDEFQIG